MHSFEEADLSQACGNSPEPSYVHPDLQEDDRSVDLDWMPSFEEPGAAFDGCGWEAWQPGQPGWFDEGAPFEAFGGLKALPPLAYEFEFDSNPRPSRGRSSSPKGPRTSRRVLGVPGTATLEEKVEQKYVGYLLGRGGQTVKEICGLWQVEMWFDQSTAKEGYSTLYIQGDPSALDQAKVGVERLMRSCDKREGSRSQSRCRSDTRGSSRRSRSASCSSAGSSAGDSIVRVDQKFVAALIGKGGSTISQLCWEENVKMNFDQSTQREGYSKLHIKGEEEAVKRAEARVVAMVEDLGGDSTFMTQKRRRFRPCLSPSHLKPSWNAWSDYDSHGWKASGPWAPTRLLRQALENLMGRWYGDAHCYQVTWSSNSKGLTCKSMSLYAMDNKENAWTSERAICWEGADIFLGERCRYFLDTLTNKTVTWVDESKKGVMLLWKRRPQAPTGPSNYDSNYATLFSQSNKEENSGFCMAAEDFPTL